MPRNFAMPEDRKPIEVEWDKVLMCACCFLGAIMIFWTACIACNSVASAFEAPYEPREDAQSGKDLPAEDIREAVQVRAEPKPSKDAEKGKEPEKKTVEKEKVPEKKVETQGEDDLIAADPDPGWDDPEESFPVEDGWDGEEEEYPEWDGEQEETGYSEETGQWKGTYDGDFQSDGKIEWGGNEYTWYSENVLPGDGLDIPGRHVNEDGYVVDGDGNICVAIDGVEYGTHVDIPVGNGHGVVYDSLTDDNSEPNAVDVYVSW